MLEEINSSLSDTEKWISNVEDRLVEITQAEQGEKNILSKDSLRGPWDNFKHTNICIIGVPEGEEREKGAKKLFEEIIAENIPNLGKETDIQVQEAQRGSNKMNLKRSTPRHIIIKMAKIKYKERILNAAREQILVTYKGSPMRLSTDLPAETLQVSREWHNVLKWWKQKPTTKKILPGPGCCSELKGSFYRKAKAKSV